MAQEGICSSGAEAGPHGRIERYEASDGHVYEIEYLDQRFVARKFAGSVYIAGPLPGAGASGLSEEQADRVCAVGKIEEKISARAASTSWHETLHDGTPVEVRPIREDDHSQLTVIDPAVDAAFVAVIVQAGGHETEIGVARFSALADNTDCEFAIEVGNAWRGKGLGRILMERLMDAARARRIPTMHALSAGDNAAMGKLADGLGMQQGRDPNDAAKVIYRIALGRQGGGPVTPS